MDRFALTVVMIPSWLLVTCICPFLPHSHPWKNRWFSPVDWAMEATEFTVNLSLVLWLSWILVLVFWGG